MTHARETFTNDDDDDLFLSSIGDDFFDTTFFNTKPLDKEAVAALKEKTPDCGECTDNVRCESNHCYFGRCVAPGAARRAHSVRRCFKFLPSSETFRGEECARCRRGNECFSGLCRFGRCVYPGVLLHMSMLTCFRDSYVSGC